MTEEHHFEQIGRFIYSAYRHGGDIVDVHRWMADDLGHARPAVGVEAVPADLYAAFFAKHAGADAFQASHDRFVEALKAPRG
ncbi:hypothetical protein [Massilia sp. Leaf139]|uniref:hypothetical protein n=1 Tax=Massilia sp. Leaf139 TaxID=1736272 RepID=UPI0006FAAEB4|nr:hypothetical protein [Massilia sp. Leaf139]KQQ96821.1 hypothetical protein ASF77_02160 [Massilia sp. Leaf139]